MKKIIYLLSFCIILFACNETHKKTDTPEPTKSSASIPDPDANPILSTAETIAYKNGFEQWKDVTEINFTFNVDRGENHFERSWVWKPQSDLVILRTAQDTVTFERGKVDSTSTKYDASFINDKYWLLAPFNLLWDEGTTITERKDVIAPISKDTLNELTITYGNEGGYTPGDAYDFYYGNDFMIREWVYRKGNDSLPSMLTTWEAYQTHKGMKISTMHKDSTGNFKLYFTNVSVK